MLKNSINLLLQLLKISTNDKCENANVDVYIGTFSKIPYIKTFSIKYNVYHENPYCGDIIIMKKLKDGK